MSALIFLRLHVFFPAAESSEPPSSLNSAGPPPPNHPTAGDDASQMKFSSPSRETVSPFVFIILTRLFKELSSSASVCHSLPGAPPGPPPAPTPVPPPPPSFPHRQPPAYPHLFGAHPERGAAMCFSHSSLPRKTSGGVGGVDGRHFLT